TQRAAVADIVRLLDGMPLAIELAASRVRLLSPAQIVERLRDRFALLAGGRDTAARQATLRGAIDWSWELLSPREQSAFAQCAVFEGGFTLAAAEATLDLARWGAAPAAIDVVQSLLDKSLLRTWHPRGDGNDDEPRFGMYVSLHDYARERLEASGESAAAEARHGHHFAVLGNRDALDALCDSNGARRRRALALELDNLVVACRRALSRGDASTAASCYAATCVVLEMQGPMALGVALGAQLAAAPMPPAPRIAVLLSYGVAAHLAGDQETGAAALHEALVLARAQGDRHAEAEILFRLGDIRFDQMHIDEARSLLDSALVTSCANRDGATEAVVLGKLATLAHHEGRWDDFQTLSTDALAVMRDTGNRRSEPALLNLRAMREHALGHVQVALELYRRAADRARELGYRGQEATALGNIAAVLLDLGRDSEAHPALQTVLAMHREVGSRFNEGTVLGNLGILHQQQGRADAAREHFEAALAIAREVENRRHELYLLGSLGELHVQQRHFDAADRCYADALERARGGSYRVTAGRLLAGLGKLRWLQHRLDDAERALAEGEELLRESGDLIELPKLLCTRGQVDLARGRRDAARATLAEAESGAAALGAGPGSEVAQDIEALRHAIG
ncbi:MAG TPA: tetratricopeptide repeat protein, partial [Burkholderiaceae bacterium]|nr:tetratricopeptide repeat protein [Burkholderiaceae bacterium]